MAPYLSAADGNKKRALALYRWSVELGASVQETLGITEVFVRNAMNEKLQEWNRRETGNPSWLLAAPASPLRSLTQGKRRDALKRAEKTASNRSIDHPRYGAEITHDDALANTMFGMWKDILPNHGPDADPEKRENRNRVRMWEEALETAFPYVVDPDGRTTYWRVAHLHLLRNRVSHMDSLLNVDVLDVIGDAFSLVGSIDPVLEQWLTGTSTVKNIYSARPQ
ncbi:hypothetical protein [Corynebacterium sp. p3-SID1056]|uniref:hypothetical protein n=1 Tax=Corynebacterium sp. p3-SID1056 TaxID=2916092 RepID=UPI0021A690BA|nr:hypothetical protein [Corynebacterium sp. p3-SID1056]MCT2339551.1 hypothetical protein [Corynebacterium sp. p3-SID1056]